MGTLNFFNFFRKLQKTRKTYIKILVLTPFISFLLFFLAPAVNLTIFGAGLIILRWFQGCFDVKCLRRNTFFWKMNSKFNKWKEFGEPTGWVQSIFQQMKGIWGANVFHFFVQLPVDDGAVGPTTTKSRSLNSLRGGCETVRSIELNWTKRSGWPLVPIGY